METTIVFRGYMGIMEKTMETGFRALRLSESWLSGFNFLGV